MTYRVVVDTNLIVSAFLWGGIPVAVLQAIIERGIPLLTSDAIIAELKATLRKPKFAVRLEAKNHSIDQLINQYCNMAKIVPLAEIPHTIVRDSKDQIILMTAVGGNATHIVSGDKDLTELGRYEQILILTAAQFLAIVHLQ